MVSDLAPGSERAGAGSGAWRVVAGMTAQRRREMVAVAAYYRAERRGFAPGGAVQDWLEAEREIDRILTRMSGLGTTWQGLERLGLRNALRLWA
jgi:Protein of unknown function (DUF2934)